MGLFLISESDIRDTVSLNPEESHHLIHVMRKKKGDKIELSNGQGSYFSAEILQIESPVLLKILSTRSSETASSLPSLILCPALLKNPKMDWLMEKATELGASQILPFISDRGVVEVRDVSNSTSKLERWRRLCQAALKQSGRAQLPEVGPILNWDSLFKRFSADEFLKLIFTIDHDPHYSISQLKTHLQTKTPFKNWVLLIGPEGGFTREEIQRAVDQGFLCCSMGPYPLRAETASLAALVLMNHLSNPETTLP